MKLPRAKAADNEGCNILKRLLVWNEKKVKPKLVVVRRAMEGGETIHFEDDRPWSSAERRTRKAQRACSAPCGWCQGRMRTQGRVRRARCFSVTDGSGRSSWTRSQSCLVRLEWLVMLCFSIHSSQDGPRSRWLKSPRRMNVQMAEMHRDVMDLSEVNNVSRDVFMPKNRM